MNANVSTTIVLGEYRIISTYGGTNTPRYWNDPFLRKAVEEAASKAGTDKDLFEYCNFIFAQVDNAIRRRYGGREIILSSIEVSNGYKSVTSYQ